MQSLYDYAQPLTIATSIELINHFAVIPVCEYQCDNDVSHPYMTMIDSDDSVDVVFRHNNILWLYIIPLEFLSHPFSKN